MPDDDPHGLTAPYVPAKDRTMVLVKVGEDTYSGVVLGWRGCRVFVQYRSDMGNHQAWVPATAVVRRRQDSRQDGETV